MVALITNFKGAINVNDILRFLWLYKYNMEIPVIVMRHKY